MNKIRIRIIPFLLLISLSTARADNAFPRLTVVPWNGHRAATSLTFDGGDPSQLDLVVPELNRRKMPGTFFLIANRISRKDEWRKLLVQGHEIGNETLDGKHASELTPKDEDAQVVGAKNVLQKEFGIAVDTFAYPFGEVSPGLKKHVEKTNLLARGDKGVYNLEPNVKPDWMNLPSRNARTQLPFTIYEGWFNRTLKDRAWMVLTIHSLEGTTVGTQPIPRKIFEKILDFLQSKDIWIGTFSEVGSYFKAQKAFEKSWVQTEGSERKYDWNNPYPFLMNVVLKIRLEMGSKGQYEIWQRGRKLLPDEKGFYPVAFDKKELTLRLLPAP
jgi:peptidoglycan-N-acetylglucosamine deacetylase